MDNSIFGDAELVAVTLLVPLTMNDADFPAGAVLKVPGDLAAAWAHAGISGDAAALRMEEA
jgi:hypothetical protein